MNDTRWNVLIKLKETTPPEAIINSWWDQGDWITSISKRRAANDAYFQYTPLPNWVARSLLTSNERESAGILRMLNSGSYNAFNELNKNFSDKLVCLKILSKLILLKQEKGYSLLMNYVKDKERAKKIGGLIYAPPPAYLVIDDSLLFRLSSINFLGRWDFKKLEIYKKSRELRKEEFIWFVFKKVIYITFNPEAIEEIVNPNEDKDLAVLLMPQEGRYRSIILDEEISKSLIVRLFFMNRIGLKHFKQVYHEKKEGLCDIYVYKIDWE